VVPSRLEGYGLPPREAAAHGTPSVVSDLPTLRLPGTLRVPPGDAAALAGALARLPAERDRLVAELPGRAHVGPRPGPTLHAVLVDWRRAR